MIMPKSWSVDIECVQHSGVLRPKSFFRVEIHCHESQESVFRFVKAGPIFLKLRLWIALFYCKRTMIKLKRFQEEHVI